MEIKTRSDLITSLQESGQRAESWFLEIPARDFFTRQGEDWSASDNVDHLIKAVQPVAKALKLPKFTLRAMFGKPQKKSLSYEELCHLYRREISKGAQASGRFLPDQDNPAGHVEKKQQELVAKFSKAGAELVSALEKWDEEHLDEYLLPHPILGKLTVREMLFFTIYHNLRHASLEGD
jgi:hypothetical protein